MSKRPPELFIEDIIDSCSKIMTYTLDMSFYDFIADSKTIDAVVRNFEIMGEAANHLPEDFKDGYPDIDWHRIMGFRNRIVHDYFGIDCAIVWQIKESFLPDLIEKLRQL